MRISDWSSDVCSSDLLQALGQVATHAGHATKGLFVGGAVGQVQQQIDTIYTGRLHVLSAYAIEQSRKARRRSEERRGGKEGVNTCRSRWSPHHENKTID